MQAAEHPIDPEELNEYLDGELAPDRAAFVQAHLAGCTSCQKLGADVQHVSRDMAAWTVEKSPENLAAKGLFAKSAVRRSWRPRWLSSSFAIPTVGLGAVAVMLVVITVNQQRKPQDSIATVSLGGRAVIGRANENPTASATLQYSKALPAAPAREEVMGAIQGASEVAAPASHVIRTATLRLISKDFDASRAMLDRIVASTGGLLGDVNVTGVRAESRSLKATVRVPSARFDTMLAELKGLGDVVNEAMSANDVTEQVIDLEARLANARNTEQRMKELLRTRTGKLTEVLEAEREVSRVREEIERLDAQRKNIASQVTYGTITLTMEEPPKSSITLGPLPLSLRLRNAFIDGFRTAFESGVGMILFLLQAGPFAIFWLLVLGIPIRFFWRRYRLIA